MKSAGPFFIAAAMLFAAGVEAQDAADANKPYAVIAARNMFGLLPIPPPQTADLVVADPPPKITPNGIMTIFGKVQALFKVSNKGKPGQPAREDSYMLTEGERQDDIEVVKIDQEDAIITFNNHGTIQELPLVAASNTSAPAVPGGPATAPGVNSGMQRNARPQVPMTPAERANMRGRPATRELETGNPGNSGVPGLGGNVSQTSNNQPPNNNIEDQVLNAAKEMALIEQNRIATQEAVDKGLLPPLPPTPLTPADATAHDGMPLIALPVEVPPPAPRR